jgi:hypothetical protein
LLSSRQPITIHPIGYHYLQKKSSLHYPMLDLLQLILAIVLGHVLLALATTGLPWR